MKSQCFGFVLLFLSAFFLNACSNTVSPSDDLENFPMEGGGESLSSANSSSSVFSSSSSETDSLGLSWVKIPNAKFVRGVTEISLSSFHILETEVTQELYADYLTLPIQKKEGDSLPVTNVSIEKDAKFHRLQVSRNRRNREIIDTRRLNIKTHQSNIFYSFFNEARFKRVQL